MCRMPPAARVTDETAHGSPLFPGTGSADVFIGGLPAWRALLDKHLCAATPDGVGTVLMGSPTVRINQAMAVRMGDIVTEVPGAAMGPVNLIVGGCATVVIGAGLGPQAAALTLAAFGAKPFCAICQGR